MDNTAQAATPNLGEELQRPPGRCSSCIRMERIAEGGISRKWEHHKNFAALDESAELGCDLCRLLRWCLLCRSFRVPSGGSKSLEVPPFAWSTFIKSTDPVYVYSTIGWKVVIRISLGDVPPSALMVVPERWKYDSVGNGGIGSEEVCSEPPLPRCGVSMTDSRNGRVSARRRDSGPESNNSPGTKVDQTMAQLPP